MYVCICFLKEKEKMMDYNMPSKIQGGGLLTIDLAASLINRMCFEFNFVFVFLDFKCSFA